LHTALTCGNALNAVDLSLCRQNDKYIHQRGDYPPDACLAARFADRSRFSSASIAAACSRVGALPPYRAGSHQQPGGCSAAG
jgi:hypothetical protein